MNVAYNSQQIFIKLIFRNLHEIGDILAKIMNIEHTKKCENLIYLVEFYFLKKIFKASNKFE